MFHIVTLTLSDGRSGWIVFPKLTEENICHKRRLNLILSDQQSLLIR